MTDEIKTTTQTYTQHYFEGIDLNTIHNNHFYPRGLITLTKYQVVAGDKKSKLYNRRGDAVNYMFKVARETQAKMLDSTKVLG